MTITSSRKSTLKNTFKIATLTLAICYINILLLQQRSLDVKSTIKHVAITNAKFVCLVNYTCLFSAYYDDVSENKSMIRIIGIDNPKTNLTSLQCFYFDGQRNLMTLPYPGRKVRSSNPYNFGYQHGLTFFKCDLDIQNEERPTYVWLGINGGYPSREDLENQMLPIHYPPAEKYRYKVAAYVKPLHSGLDDVQKVLEWMEYMRLIGVEHFTVYNYRGGTRVLDLLKSYGPDVVTLMNWNLPVLQGINWYGEYVAASECVYRYRGVAKYVMAFDVDEFPIVPKGFQNVYDYLDNLWGQYEKLRNISINSAKFNSQFSFLSWAANTSMVPVKQEHSRIHGVLNRLNIPTTSNFLPGGQTKFVYKPELVEESGVHWVDKGVEGSTCIQPPPQEAYYFHFRRCVSYYYVPNPVLLNKATCNQAEGIETDAYPASAYGSQLMHAVTKKIYSSVKLQKVFNISLDTNFT